VQTVEIDTNWKIARDSYCETYHVETVHPLVGRTGMANCLHFRGWDDSRGMPRNSCFMSGSKTIKLYADGDASPDIVGTSQPVQPLFTGSVWHLAFNSCMVWNANLGFNLSQICPGESPGKTTIRMTDYRQQLPDGPPNLKSDVAFFTIACEDMPLMPKIYNSFLGSRSATTVFGRNEPCLTYQHHCYLALANGEVDTTHLLRGRAIQAKL